MKDRTIVPGGTYHSTISIADTTQWLCHFQIETLCDKMLTPGLHHIAVSDILEGRALLYRVLSALDCYENIACLSIDHDTSWPTSITDIYQELVVTRSLDDIQGYLISEACFDFIWIEATRELLKKEWYADFEKGILDLGLDQKTAIVTLTL